jgi:hypothetical protein
MGEEERLTFALCLFLNSSFKGSKGNPKTFEEFSDKTESVAMRGLGQILWLVHQNWIKKSFGDNMDKDLEVFLVGPDYSVSAVKKGDLNEGVVPGSFYDCAWATMFSIAFIHHSFREMSKALR